MGRLGIVSDCLSEDFALAARIARDNGCEWLEYRAAQRTQGVSPAQREVVRALTARGEVRLCGVNFGLYRTSLYEPAFEEQFSVFGSAVDLALECGLPQILLYGVRRHVNDKRGDYARITEALGKCLDHAAAHGLHCALENDKSHFADEQGNVTRLLRVMDSHGLRSAWNIKALFECGAVEWEIFYQTLLDKLSYVRVRDYQRRPDLPWLGILRAVCQDAPELPIVVDCVGREDTLAAYHELRAALDV